MTQGPIASERREKVLSLVALTLSIELVFFKFLPDLSTALIQNSTSALTDFSTYRHDYLVPGSVHYARFLGNHILYYLALALDRLFHSGDVRLHPLRLAAAVLTPLYAVAGTYFVLQDRENLAWRYFLASYALAVIIGLYVFYPADMPALAATSAVVYCLVRERLGAALAFTLLLGLFRESAFHAVALVCIWALCNGSRPAIQRLGWPAVFAVLFTVEYIGIRHIFPGPVTSVGGIILDPREVFFGRGLVSLTTLCSLSLAALYPIACVGMLRAIPASDWRRKFYLLNAWLFPFWIVFYRMMNGNITEFRLLLPALVPCMYGIAYAAKCRVAVGPSLEITPG